MPRRKFITLAALLLGAGVGCTGGPVARHVSDSTFVRTMVQLRRVAADSSLDSASRDSARKATLERNGLTATELEQAAASLASDPDRAARLWRVIEGELAGRPLPNRVPAQPAGRRTG